MNISQIIPKEKIAGPEPIHEMLESDQAFPAGMWRTRVQGDKLYFERATATDWSTAEAWMTFDKAAEQILLGKTVDMPATVKYGDDEQLLMGDDNDYWLVYNSTGTQWELWASDVDGGGTDGLVISIADGTDDVIFTGGIDVDGIAYIDDMSVPNGFSMVSETTAFSHFDSDSGAWDFFTKTSGAAQLSRLRIPSGTDSVDIALANANLLFGSGFGIRANAANGTIVDFEAYENGAYVTVANMNSSATIANWVFQRTVIFNAPEVIEASDATLDTNGDIAVTDPWHELIPFGGVGSVNDTLNKATGGQKGQRLRLSAKTTAGGGNNQITIADSTGADTFILAGGAAFLLDHMDDAIWFTHNGTEWAEDTRSSNS